MFGYLYLKYHLHPNLHLHQECHLHRHPHRLKIENSFEHYALLASLHCTVIVYAIIVIIIIICIIDPIHVRIKIF